MDPTHPDAPFGAIGALGSVISATSWFLKAPGVGRRRSRPYRPQETPKEKSRRDGINLNR